ncbi:SpaH/EbpB family LPXTG-anchored major pilin [Enterococcus pseudoavium]|uniref:SpaH/EbpB family LPXTG-anchored major pilin n=1 Tax=Enterococcus pseudoavium TaxID=44007 RepID=A0AAE4L4G0_9ENTE|nr:SpaH/EbpB family LPXTG-anchored major pilin [Enterococcus pseudoavium]MDT2737854.1 SpaH/EbpB family LPXTG-anchored major pilin [Enterococcus pseudoavium]
MKARGKIISLLTTILCLVPMFVGVLGMGEEASAAIQNIDVTLHKKKMDEFPIGGILNTGEEMNEFKDYEALPDVEFTAYEITNDFYVRLEAELDGKDRDSDDIYEAAVKKVMNSYQAAPGGATQVGQDSTDVNGNVTFSNLPDRDSNGRYHVYLFIEKEVPGLTQFSQPLVMMLPLKGESGNELTHIHLYPKNKVQSDIKKELLDADGTALDNKDLHSYDVGKEIKYKTTFTIPSQIGEIVKDENKLEQTRYSKLVFRDAMDTAGILFKQIDKIVIGGAEVSVSEFTGSPYATTTYTNNAGNYGKDKLAGFEISMNLNAEKSPSTGFDSSKAVAEYLAKYSGKKIEIFYTMAFTEDTPVDKGINNDFSVTLKQVTSSDEEIRKPDDTPKVITGGKKFMKHEDGKPEQGLAGAEFVVIKKAGGKEYYLAPGEGNRNWVEVATGEDYSGARKLVSKSDGSFEITGLEFGDYQLREIKAPDGFQKLDKDVPFTIAEGSYAGPSAEVQKVMNTSRGGFLPSTGGKGIVAFLLIGFALMAFAVVRYRKVHEQTA